MTLPRCGQRTDSEEFQFKEAPSEMPENQLLWQPGFSLSRQPVKKSVARRNRPAANGDAPQQYEFICEYPVPEPVPSDHEPQRSI